jgi:hypothetical protein
LINVRSGARDWRAVARAWGRHGNDRLTASVGLVFVVLLAVEAWTTFSLRSYLSLHMYLGFVLLPPVVLKLASTGWRAARYYGAAGSTGSQGHRSFCCGCSLRFSSPRRSRSSQAESR